MLRQAVFLRSGPRHGPRRLSPNPASMLSNVVIGVIVESPLTLRRAKIPDFIVVLGEETIPLLFNICTTDIIRRHRPNHTASQQPSRKKGRWTWASTVSQQGTLVHCAEVHSVLLLMKRETSLEFAIFRYKTISPFEYELAANNGVPERP